MRKNRSWNSACTTVPKHKQTNEEPLQASGGTQSQDGIRAHTTLNLMLLGSPWCAASSVLERGEWLDGSVTSVQWSPISSPVKHLQISSCVTYANVSKVKEKGCSFLQRQKTQRTPGVSFPSTTNVIPRRFSVPHSGLQVRSASYVLFKADTLRQATRASLHSRKQDLWLGEKHFPLHCKYYGGFYFKKPEKPGTAEKAGSQAGQLLKFQRQVLPLTPVSADPPATPGRQQPHCVLSRAVPTPPSALCAPAQQANTETESSVHTKDIDCSARLLSHFWCSAEPTSSAAPAPVPAAPGPLYLPSAQ